MDEKDNTWQAIKARIKEHGGLSEVAFKTWIEPLEFKIVNDTVFVFIPMEAMVASYIRKRYYETISSAVRYVLDRTDLKVKMINVDDSIDTDTSEGHPSEELKTENEKNQNRYTFENFIFAPYNSLAVAAAQAVAEVPGDLYNPLYIYGKSGLGKTHLLHAIMHKCKELYPEKNIIYATAETFTNDLIMAVRSGSCNNMQKFREKYRNADVLIVDDFQFILGKEATTEEFFHTLNTLVEDKKQLIIASDILPRSMMDIHDRNRRRLEMGLIVDISKPDYEARLDIIKTKLGTNEIPEEVLRYIAENFVDDVRELVGAFNKVCARQVLFKERITLEIAKSILETSI